jgi:hypothetical protein
MARNICISQGGTEFMRRIKINSFIFMFLLISNGYCAWSDDLQSNKELKKQEILKDITKNSWCHEGAGPGDGFAGDTENFKFKPNGTYEYHLRTDYNTPIVYGKWNLKQNTKGEWFIIKDNGEQIEWPNNYYKACGQ